MQKTTHLAIVHKVGAFDGAPRAQQHRAVAPCHNDTGLSRRVVEHAPLGEAAQLQRGVDAADVAVDLHRISQLLTSNFRDRHCLGVMQKGTCHNVCGADCKMTMPECTSKRELQSEIKKAWQVDRRQHMQ